MCGVLVHTVSQPNSAVASLGPLVLSVQHVLYCVLLLPESQGQRTNTALISLIRFKPCRLAGSQVPAASCRAAVSVVHYIRYIINITWRPASRHMGYWGIFVIFPCR
ncbi:hypothetical protein J6590_071384 [Homalodisca vitripennis]|nr:hypothetical protein J6590_071384 [Homalodisca vitripennis]